MVDILLSVYNGEKYLSEQIESIISQDYNQWRLIIRDDCSNDRSLEIINKFQNKFPDKITVLCDNFSNLGCIKSFEKLVMASTSEYFMFCDQDDVWKNDKISLSLQAISKFENTYPSSPVLVFTDLEVVDNNLRSISESFFKSQRLNPNVCYNLYKSLALNVAPGCTMILNRECRKYILPFQDLIHDYWAINIVNYYGHVTFLDKSTIYYRQHSRNTVGANDVDTKYLIKRLKHPLFLFNHLNKGLKSFPFKINMFKFWIYKISQYLYRFF